MNMAKQLCIANHLWYQNRNTLVETPLLQYYAQRIYNEYILFTRVMHAAVTLPSDMASIPCTMSKINKNVYYDPTTQSFYKVTILDPLTMFTNNDLITRQNLIITKYDPSYLVLQILSHNTQISVCSIPKYLNIQHFRPFVHFDGPENQSKVMKTNTQAILNFLEKRIDQMLKVIEQKQYVKTQRKFQFKQTQKPVNHSSQNRKPISLEVVQLLRKQIPDIFIQELLRIRYHEQKQIRPILLDSYVQQVNKQEMNHKDKYKKKPVSKPKPAPVLDKNQPTLFKFSAKKQTK